MLPHCKFISATVYLNSVLAFLGTLISSKSRVYLLTDRDQVGQSASRSVGFSKWTVLIGRSGFDTRPDNEFFELSVGVACDAYLLEIEGLLTQGSRPGRTSGGSVGEVSEMDRSDWSCGIRYQNFDTEFKPLCPQNHSSRMFTETISAALTRKPLKPNRP